MGKKKTSKPRKAAPVVKSTNRIVQITSIARSPNSYAACVGRRMKGKHGGKAAFKAAAKSCKTAAGRRKD
jgi:hypothetical protein